MCNVTDLSHDQIYKVFDMLDVDRSGLIDFDEFYLLVCILISINVSLYPVLNTYLYTHTIYIYTYIYIYIYICIYIYMRVFFICRTI